MKKNKSIKEEFEKSEGYPTTCPNCLSNYCKLISACKYDEGDRYYQYYECFKCGYIKED